MSVLHPTSTPLTYSHTTNATLVGSSLTRSKSHQLHYADAQSYFPTFREARIEFGEDVANTLKLSEDGAVVLWPQPTDDPEDPQNVCCTRLNDCYVATHHCDSGQWLARTFSYSSSR